MTVRTPPETYPDAHWLVQVRQALQGLLHAANLARAQQLPAIPAHIAGPLIDAYRHGVRIGLKEVARVPGRKQPKHRALLEDLRDREADILRFTTDLRIPPTSNQAERDLRPVKTQQKSPDGSPARTSPNTGTPSAAMSPP